MADPFINSLTASGVYRQLFDRSRVVTNASNITPIIFGFSKKGLFNTAVFCPDTEFFISNFGNVDYSLERKGSYFHRAALELLEQGPIFVINLYDLSSESPATPPATPEEFQAQLNDPNYDLTDYKGMSLGSTIFNKPNIIEPVVNFYNKERFWFADTEALLATNGSDDQLISFVNLSQRSVSVITQKSDVVGFNVKAQDYYGVGNVPDFMNPNDYLEDYFIDVIIFEGDFTNYAALAIDPVFGTYFDANNGFRKELLSEFAALPQVNVLGSFSGAVIPDFVDQNGTNRYIQSLVNQETTTHGVLCSINEEIFDNEVVSGTKVDLVGHDIERRTNEGLNRIEFLSYRDAIVSDLTYQQRQLVVNASGAFSNTSNATIGVLGSIVTADVAGAADGRYILDGQNIIQLDRTTVLAETFNPILNDTTVTLANTGNVIVTAVRVNSTPVVDGVDYTVAGNVVTFTTPFAGTETVEVDYSYQVQTLILQPQQDYVVFNSDTFNAGAAPGWLKYSTGAWAATNETITAVEDIIADAVSAAGVPAGIYIQDDTKEIVAVEAGAVSGTLAVATTGSFVINKDAENVVLPVPAYLKFDGADWVATDGSEVIVNGIKISVGTLSALYTTLTTDYTIPQLADHVYIRTTASQFAKILQAGEALNFLDLEIEQAAAEVIQSPYEIMIDPIYFDYEVSLDSYIVTSGVALDIPQLYADIANGTIVSGDTVSYDPGTGITDAFIKVSPYIDELNFAYPAATTDGGKVMGYMIEFFSSSDLAAGNKLTGADVPLFGETYVEGALVAGDELAIQTLKGSLNETFSVTEVSGVPNEFILSASDVGEIVIGHYIVSNPGDSINNVPSRMTRVNRVTQLQNGDQQIRTDEPVFIRKATITDTFGDLERYERIENFVDFLDMTHLYGFRIKDRLLPQPGDGDVSTYQVLTNTNLYSTLSDRSIISYRYIVDTFNKGISAQSKSILTSLAAAYKDALAICNGPSAKEFADSTDPIFTDAPTPTNPNPELNHRYVASGGNQALNPQGTYSLPGESAGGAYGAFYYPNLVVNERNKNFTVPPAMYVAKNFIEKHRSGNPWDIIAGRRRGLISGRNVIGIETVLTTADREYLEPFGLNPLTNEPGVGIKINSNQTAKQQIVSALSFVNVTEVIIEVQKGIEAILQNYLWEFNTAQNRLEIKTLADNFLEQVRLRNGVFAFENVMDSSNNPNEIIDQQKGVLDTYVEPVKGLGILVHRTTILNTGQIESGDFQRL